MRPRSLRRATTRYSVPPSLRVRRHANGCRCSRPAFLSCHVRPSSVDLYTPRPNAVAYTARRPRGLAGSTRTWVIALSAIPPFEGVQVRPPSVDTPTPPWNFSGSVRRHIFGRGRSWVPLNAPQGGPFPPGSNPIQYVVLRHRAGTPRVEPVQVSPPSSLRNRPMSVVLMKTRFASNGSQCTPYVLVTSSPRLTQASSPRRAEFTCAHVRPPSRVRYVRNRSVA